MIMSVCARVPPSPSPENDLSADYSEVKQKEMIETDKKLIEDMVGLKRARILTIKQTGSFVNKSERYNKLAKVSSHHLPNSESSKSKERETKNE